MVWSDVYWIGGSPCSGKSSIAERLVVEHGMRAFHCDDHFDEHIAAAHPRRQPHLHSLRNLSWDALFMQPVPVQVSVEIAIYREEFELILRDLGQLRGTKPVVVEGAALLPDLLMPFLPGPSHAIFFIPSGEFQRTTYAHRPWRQDILAQCRDPDQAWENWMARDELLGAYVAAKARAASLAVLPVDGSQSVKDYTRAAAIHFDLK